MFTFYRLKADTPLIRGLDPLLGVFTGVLAYYLYETNPRTAPPPDQRLLPLVQWKLDQRKKAKAASLAQLEAQEELDLETLLQDAQQKE